MDQKKKKKNDEPKGFAGTVFTLVHDLVYVLAAITVVFVFLARLTGVNGSSMFPTLVGARDIGSAQGDYLLLESNVLNAEYKKGDIVVACVPTFDENRPIVKRVIAVPGQTVDLQLDQETGNYCVYVDGEKLDEPYIREPMAMTMYETIEFPATVPDNCFFIMGDNRNNSNDSRNPSIGMVNRQYIVGKAMFIVFPGQTEGGSRDWSRLLTLGSKR